MTRFLASLLSAMLLVASGAVLAGTGTGSTVITPTTQASSDQDPKSPPDCKKYPKDTRCKK